MFIMAFCGQCGLLLNPDAQKCPRCGTATDFDAIVPATPTNTNEATFIARADKTQLKEIPHTPPPQAAPTSSPSYPVERTSSPGYTPQSGSGYPIPGVSVPNYMPQSASNYAPPGVSQPGFYPITDPGYPSQPPVQPPKKRTWPLVLVVLLALLLGAGTATLFILGPTHLPQMFGSGNVATPTAVPTAQPSPTTQPQSTPTAQPSPTVQPSPTAQPCPTPQPSPTPQVTQQAQASVQQYFTDINNKDYQSAYNIWVNNPQTYAQFQQGFAHTQHDDITLGDAIVQSDGSVQVNITIRSTEDAASGTGTQVSTYQGYYIMGQQADGSWKIVTANIN